MVNTWYLPVEVHVIHNDVLLGVTDTAHKLRVSADKVRTAADRGALRCQRDSVGRRLFRIQDVRAYRRELRKRRRRGEPRLGRPRAVRVA
jgi:hypothetical protein